jgi:2',3'-cyclic-nucleotide 2'-phosphodiesterase (5'-nucleotidase family)
MNSMNYTAFDLGNHEFNFGSKVFVDTFSKASFPILGANVSDSGLYGINKVSTLAADGKPVVNVRDSLEVPLASCATPPCTTAPINVAILGLTNHRVPSYELPSNIPGLTFTNPIQTAKDLVPALRASNDVVLAMTHIGFTTDPKSVEVDDNVDTNLAAQVAGIDAIIGSHSHTNPLTGSDPYKYLPALVANPDGKSVLINQAYRYNTFLGEIILGVRPKSGGGYEVVSTAGKDIPIDISTPEDPQIKAILDPYVSLLASYNDTYLGLTTQPIDTMQAFTQETNGANMQADASVYELEKNGIAVDFHLSGAMTNSKIADSATPASPFALKVSDMFTSMPYENSLLVISMNGPQIKAVLERGYRNYYYYKYVSGRGGYSYYTTCMLDINSGGKITYAVPSMLPGGNNVVSLEFDGKFVDFTDATKYYKVSTVNYLAAGACNMSDAGVTLWPLNQIANDTQFYVRDAVIDYVKAQGTVNPLVEGRLNFIILPYNNYLAFTKAP